MNNFIFNNVETTYFRKAARTFYVIAIVSFTICLLLNQYEYYKNSRWHLIITDVISILFIYASLVIYLKNKINFKLASAVYVYTTLLNLSISTWFYYYLHVYFMGNFLFGTFLYCINIVVAGFCVGRKHAFIAAGLYVLSLGPLIFVSHDDYLYQNAITILFLIVAFSMGVSGFLNVLEKTHNEELELKDKIFEKDKALAEEHNRYLNSALEIKQKEIVAKTMFLIEYAENNTSLINKLNNLKKRIHNSEYDSLNDIIDKHRIEHHEKYWKEFEACFLAVNPEFYKKLIQICPELSQSEQKLAALVHLGLSSKQIGGILANTPESVDVARSRLRNKLNLSADTNLKAFLTRV